MDYVDELINVLNGELGLYRDLYKIALKKTDIIVNGITKELDNLTVEEDNILFKLSKFEDERKSILQDSIGDKNATLSDIFDVLPSNYKQGFTKIQNDFILILNKLKERNNLNKSLLKQSLDYINYSLNFIQSSLNQDSIIYGPKDKVEQHINLIDKKA